MSDAFEGKILTDADIRKMMNNDHTPPASPEKPDARIAAGVARDGARVRSLPRWVLTHTKLHGAGEADARQEQVRHRRPSFSSAASVAP